MKKLKKSISMLLVISIIAGIFAMCGVTAFAEDDILSYLTYEIIDGEVTITDCDTSISGAVVIPDTIDGYPVTVLGERVFSECIDIENIDLPETITHINDSAFNQCEKLKELYIPKSVEYMNPEAICCCFALENINVDENNAYYASENGVLFDKDKTVLYRYPAGKTATEYSIPDGVKTIYEFAFDMYTPLEYINIPDSMQTIKEGAFVYCTRLKELVVPDGVTSVGNYFALYCLSLESLTLGENTDRFYAENAQLAMSMKDLYVYNPDMIFDEKSAGYIMADTNAPFDEFVNYFTLWMYDSGTYGDYINSNMIWYDTPQPIEGFTIYGYEDSTAQTYAEENGFNFIALCRHNYVDTVITPATYSQAGEGGKVCEHCGEVLETYEIPMLEINDSEEKEDVDTGVSVIFPEDRFDGKAEIEVTPVVDGDAYKLVSHHHGKSKVTMFDINVTVDGEKVQPNGTVLVKIPLPKGYNHGKCAVFYVAEDGTMERLKTYRVKDGYIYFETDHFSYYAVIDETEETSGGAAWMDESLSVIDRFMAFINAIIDWFKSIFGMA